MREKQGRKPYKTAVLAMVAEMRLSSGCSNALMREKQGRKPYKTATLAMTAAMRLCIEKLRAICGSK
jgi:hypothetical protein